MGNTVVTPSSANAIASLLETLLDALRETERESYTLEPALISYIFLPLSTILRRNTSTFIPDVILERILLANAILCESWWWTCEIAVWEQLVMLCGSIVGGMEGKGKGKTRDDETKAAAVRCLWALLHRREADKFSNSTDSKHAQARMNQLVAHAQTPKLFPIIGQTLDYLLGTALSSHLPLQSSSLDVLLVVVNTYIPESFVPSILPGIISSMCKIALGTPSSKGWAKGETVSRALAVMQAAILRSICDEVCVSEGAVRKVDTLEEFAEAASNNAERKLPREHLPSYATERTPSWLQGTTSQLHIALNSINPLVSHPSPSAQRATARFAAAIIEQTTLTLPQSQTLLLSMLLSLSTSSMESVYATASTALRRLLAPHSVTAPALIQVLVQITRDSLTTLPRLLLSHADAKVTHAAGIITATCLLAQTSKANADMDVPKELHTGVPSVIAGIAKLLGPTGGVERWGYSLLSVLEFVSPAVAAGGASVGQLLLESNVGSAGTAWPEMQLRHVATRDAQDALSGMFRALGSAAKENAEFALEWFVGVGRRSRGPSAVAALWCAARLLEGAAGLNLDEGTAMDASAQNKRLEKYARALAKSIAEAWDEPDEKQSSSETAEVKDESLAANENRLVEHVSGLVTIKSHVGAHSESGSPSRHPGQQHVLHKAASLQILAVTAGILQSRFPPLLLQSVYPILHSLVAPIGFLSSIAFATLHFISRAASFASPANLLLSNFDYALDGVARRLSRRWLDIDAARVLALLVRLVGRNIVTRASDVVEACFDRLDEYHGYSVLVEGLIEVLSEVMRVIEVEEDAPVREEGDVEEFFDPKDSERLDAFEAWFSHRHDPPERDDTDYGPAPRKAWTPGRADDPSSLDAQATPNPAAPGADTKPEATPTQALTKQIVGRSMFFLTHPSPGIRSQILNLLASATLVLPGSALLSSIHEAWPFIMNRLSDPETQVVGAAASLVAALASHLGGFMYRRIWDEVWPRFRTLLARLYAADKQSALARCGRATQVIGTESAYTHSHRLHRAVLVTMTAAAKGVRPRDAEAWEVMVAFPRFLDVEVHPELQDKACELYLALGTRNADAVWLVLEASRGQAAQEMGFMHEPKWNIAVNADKVLEGLDSM